MICLRSSGVLDADIVVCVHGFVSRSDVYLHDFTPLIFCWCSLTRLLATVDPHEAKFSRCIARMNISVHY
jgi:hypothetical protein